MEDAPASVQALKIEGGVPLRGEIRVGGSKNAALPMMAASLLTREKVVLTNVPQLMDIDTMTLILLAMGVRPTWLDDHTLELQSVDDTKTEAPARFVREMRASICVLGPTLARRKRARVFMPGGCVIGPRPVDLHLKGMRALGARVDISHGDIIAEADELRGAEVYLGGMYGSTVLGTCNVLCAASLAKGCTIIDNAACEPEVQELCHMLNAMGARISGIGSKRLIVEGVEELHGVEHAIIPDRIEASTYLIAGAITGGDLLVRGCRRDHMGATLDVFSRMGVPVSAEPGGLRVNPTSRPQAADLSTLPYPGFPTDTQAPIMALLSLADGISALTERVYPDRFMHLAEFSRLGAQIRKENATSIIIGVDRLSGAQVMASDLRAGAALVLAGLVAEGETVVSRAYHIDRGYEHIERRLAAAGARITRFEEEIQRRPPSLAPGAR